MTSSKPRSSTEVTLHQSPFISVTSQSARTNAANSYNLPKQQKNTPQLCYNSDIDKSNRSSSQAALNYLRHWSKKSILPSLRADL